MKTKEFAGKLYKLGYSLHTSSSDSLILKGQDAMCLISETRANIVHFRIGTTMGSQELDLVNEYAKTPIDMRNYKEFR